MSKAILLILVLLLAYWIFFVKKAKPHQQRSQPSGNAEKMVVCAYCGLHHPQSESLTADEHSYCCAEHRRLDNPDQGS